MDTGQHSGHLEPRACRIRQPSPQDTINTPVTPYESGRRSGRPPRSNAVRRDRLGAFTQFVLHHQSMVYNLAYRILGDEVLAVTAVENAIQRVYPVAPRFRKPPRLWLLRIVVTACQEQLCRLPHLDASSRDPLFADPIHKAITGPSACQPSRDDAQVLLNTLPADQRVTVVLSDVQGLSYREIADITGVSVDVIRSRLSQARTALRNALLAQGEFPPGAEP